MTLTELKTHFEAAAGMIAREKKKRQAVLANSPLLPQKLAECDRALAAVVAMKDELKRLIAPPAAQETLFDVPETKSVCRPSSSTAIARELKGLRREGYTLNEVSKRSGVALSTISYWRRKGLLWK